MVDLLDALVKLLRETAVEPLASTNVEKYYRLEFPATATVWVHPEAWPEQPLAIGGQVASPLQILILAEVPWSEPSAETDGDLCCKLAQQLRGIIRDNREVVVGTDRWQRGKTTECRFAFAERADNRATLIAALSITYTKVGE